MTEPETGLDFELEQISNKETTERKTTLYQIENDYLSLMSEIEETEGEMTKEQNELLVINESQLQGKTIAYLEVIKSKEAFNSNIDAEIKRLQAMKKSNSNLVDRLNNSLLDAVKLYGDITSGLTTFTTRKSESVVIEDEELIDKEYKTIKVTTSVSKTDIKKAIKSGIEVPGAILQENQNLRIK